MWQLALSFMLLIGAALMLRSFAKLQGVDAGFRTENVLTMALDLNFSRYTTAEHHADLERIGRFYDGLHDALRALPGVVHVARGLDVPAQQRASATTARFVIEGRGRGRRSAEGHVPSA